MPHTQATQNNSALLKNIEKLRPTQLSLKYKQKIRLTQASLFFFCQSYASFDTF